METRELQIVSLYNEGQSLKQIGDSFGVTHERIRQILDKEKIKRRPVGRPPKLRYKKRFGRLTTKEKFLSKVFYTHDDHWVWNGMVRPYNHFRINNRSRYAHHAAFIIFKGREPEGRLTRVCNQPGCVNPDHWKENPKKK